MKKILSFILILSLFALLLCSCGETAENYTAEIVIKDYGTITVELNGEAAPITVNNFVKLAESGFYDGLTFHRIMEGFMMQGGDPEGTGAGDSAEKIKGEFSLNGYDNPIKHERGVISMARKGWAYEQYLAYGYTIAELSDALGVSTKELKAGLEDACNSGSCQFFIVHETSSHLDGSYAAFGKVTSGMDIVDRICTEATPSDSNGTIPADQQPIIETIRIIK